MALTNRELEGLAEIINRWFKDMDIDYESDGSYKSIGAALMKAHREGVSWGWEQHRRFTDTEGRGA